MARQTDWSNTKLPSNDGKSVASRPAKDSRTRICSATDTSSENVSCPWADRATDAAMDPRKLLRVIDSMNALLVPCYCSAARAAFEVVQKSVPGNALTPAPQTALSMASPAAAVRKP